MSNIGLINGYQELPEIKITKLQNKTKSQQFVSDKLKFPLYLNDTIQDIKHKIALSIYLEKQIIGNHIYLFIKNNKKEIPLGFSYDEEIIFNLWDQKEYDNYFVYRDGTPKIEVTQYINDNQSIEKILISHNLEIKETL